MPTPYSTINEEKLLELDRQHVWHPYSSPFASTPIFPIDHANGVHLYTSDGTQLIDGMSSWWSTIHGYNHPALNNALLEQSKKISHVMFGGLTHEPAVSLCKKLAEISPEGLEHVFLSDSGSVSVEVAMKMAVQYWRGKEGNENTHSRTKFLALRKGYHGDTLGAMSVCDPVTGMHQIFKGYLQENIFAPEPQCDFHAACSDEEFETFIQLAVQHQKDIAAVILEPIVQGAGGMRFYSPEFLQRVRTLCNELNLLLIADEIATGFGRTGKLFACEHANISPDIMCLGKSLTGGYMTLAATLCTPKVAEQVCKVESGVFMHGPTFMGNPLACAVANASIDLLTENDWQSNISRIEKGLHEGLSSCKTLNKVKEVRILGAIGVIELHEPVDMARIQPLFVEHGIWIRPFGKLVYTMPAFIISNEELEKLCRKIFTVLEKWEEM